MVLLHLAQDRKDDNNKGNDMTQEARNLRDLIAVLSEDEASINPDNVRRLAEAKAALAEEDIV